MADNGRHSSGGSGSHHAHKPVDTPPMYRFRADRKESWSRGPRGLFLQRCDNGFGFTLRHFIVYPPESYTVLQGDHRLGFHHGRQGAALDEPMDTIFVKNVRENSPAHTAGLSTGDRIISVNGQTITGHTYAQVVQLIQQSGSFLHLLVVPKEDDILQLYFGETAHNPETNQRPSRVKSAEVADRRHAAGSMLQHHLTQQQATHHHRHRHHLSPQESETWSSLPSPDGLLGSENCGTSSYHSGQDPTWLRSHHHNKNASGRRSSESTGLTRREAIYGYPPVTSSEHHSSRSDHQYYSNPGGEQHISADNAVWGTSPNVSTVFKPLQILDERRLPSKDMVVMSGSASLYPASKSDNCRNLLSVQRQQMVVTPTPSNDSMANSRYGSSENVHGSSNSLQGLYYPGSPGCRLSLDGGRRESSVSLPSSSIHDNFTSDGSKDSLLSYDSTSTLTGGQEGCSSDDSLIISRIRKSFEQKEEFLRRPNQPISWNLPENINQQQQQQLLQHTGPLSTHAQAIIAREFYARPQKFQRPVWPPQSPSASPSPTSYRQSSPSRTSGSSGKTNHSNAANNKPTHQSLRRVKSDIDSERDSLLVKGSNSENRSTATFERASSEPCEDYGKSRGQFICGGPVTNVPHSTINKGGYSPSIDSGASQFRPITPVSGTSPGANHRHAGGKTAFVTTLSRIHENIPASDSLSDYLSGNYTVCNMSDGYDEPYSNGGTSSLPPSLPSSPVADSQQFSRSLSSPTEDGNTSSTRYPQHPMLQLVSRRARQFETGVLDEEESPSDRTSLYRSELSRLSAKKSVPNVAVRKREFESRAGSSNRSTIRESRRPNRESRSLESAEPPPSAQDDPSSGPVKLRARSNSAESWAAAVGAYRNRSTVEWPPSRAQEPEPQRHKAVRQDSYLAAVRTPVSTDRQTRLKRQAALSVDEEPSEVEETGPTALPIVSVQPATPSCPVVRPTQLSIPYPLQPAEPIAAVGEYGNEHQDNAGRLVAAPDSTSTVPVATVPMTLASDTQSSPTLPAAVVRRQKTQQPLAEEERLGRRVSYLKATWGDRMHVDSDLDLSDCESPHMPHHRSTSSSQSALDQPLQLDDKENLVLFREGWLQCKITHIDGKRAGDRSWKQVWAVLRGPILSLCKERRENQNPNQTPLGTSDSDQQIDTRTSQIDVAGDYTKRKHVLRVNTSNGSEVLLQAEDADDMINWLQCLNEHGLPPEECNADGKTKPSSPQPSTSYQNAAGSIRLSPLPAHKGIKKLTVLRNRSPTGQSPVNKTRKPSQTDQQLPSPKHKTWKGRVARQLRRIQHSASSPSSPTAQHPEGVTIGVPLEHCPCSTFSIYVPLLVELCTSIVDTRGLEVIGIYRVPGNTAAVAALTESVNKGFETSALEDPRWHDVNVISSLLKLFFRSLPDALFTSELYPHFITADKLEDPNKRILALKKLVHELPDFHFETLKYLLYHLKRVVEHCERNKMEARNLAIVFGPTLVRRPNSDMVTLVTDMSSQCRIVELLITHVDWFFSEDDGNELSNFPFPLTREPTELEVAAANNNLLLSNIRKVQGIKGETSSRDINAKDLVSSIISAANRKIQKSKAKKSGGGATSTHDDGREPFTECGEDKKSLIDQKPKISEPPPATDEAAQQSVVASSILESVILSGHIVNRLNTAEDNMEESTEAESVLNMAKRWEGEPSSMSTTNTPPTNEEGTIRTYAGLSATTQERIRRFELETKAMLQRDQTRHRHELEKREADKLRIELQWQQAKRDLESEDHLDKIADNLSDVGNSAQKGLHDELSGIQQLSLLAGEALPEHTNYEGDVQPYSVTTRKKQPRTAHSGRSSGSIMIDDSSENAERVGSASFIASNLAQRTSATEIGDFLQDTIQKTRGNDLPGIQRYTSHTISPSSDEAGARSYSRGKKKIQSTRSVWEQESSMNKNVCDQGENAANLKFTSPNLSQDIRSTNTSVNSDAVYSSRNEDHFPNIQPFPSHTICSVPTDDQDEPDGLPYNTGRKMKVLSTHDCHDQEQYMIENVCDDDRPVTIPTSHEDKPIDDESACPKSNTWDNGSDLLASLTSTFDRKLKSLLYASPLTSEIETVPSQSVSEVTSLETCLSWDGRSSQSQDRFGKPIDGEETQEPLKGTVDKPPVSSNSQEEPNISVDIQTAPMKKGVSTATTIFRDPSLHRGRSSPLERQSRVEHLVESIDNRSMESQSSISQEQDRGRGRTRVALGNNTDKAKDDPGTEDKESLGTKVKRTEPLTKSEKTESASSSTKLKRSESLTKAEKEEVTFTNTKLKRSESLTKAEKVSSCNTKLRRSESLTKAERADSPSNTKLKRSDSLTKTEKTESNNSKRKQDLLLLSSSFRNSNRGCNKEKENMVINLTKLKRKNGMPERSIKRRHTVGGTKDFDKLNWLDNRLQQQQLDENEASMAINNKERHCLRTSSPDLSSSRLSGILARERFLVDIRKFGGGGIMTELGQNNTTTGRPHSLPDPNLASRVFKVPLESHV